MAYISFQPSDHFNVTTYSGNGSTGRALTGVGFAPDFLWVKERSNDTGAHFLNDIIRGETKYLQSNSTSTEADDSNVITSLDSDGFTVGNDDDSNASGDTYVAYSWKGAGSSSANSNGSISSTVSANTTAGFSIVKYTGTGSNGTVGHGLGSNPPAFIMIKRYDAGANSWVVQVKGLNAAAHLNETVAFTSSYSTYFNSAHATTDVFAVGTGSGGSNVSGGSHIAYCFSNVEGHQKAGVYVGNGDSNGAFVYCGFKPNFVIIKNTAATAQWQMRDGKRGFNGAIKTLYTDSTEVETSGDTIDLVSNGFKIRNNSAVHNTASTNYAFLAIAEAPIVASNGDVGTAR